MKNEKKKIMVDFKNPEGRIKLHIEGKNATENALKIMKAFDDACDEIRKVEIEDEVKE